MHTFGSPLSAEELEFCISALQLAIEDAERELAAGGHSKDTRIRMNEYIQKLDEIQDQFLLQNNAFKSADLLLVSDLVEDERDRLNEILDEPHCTGEMRAEAQRHLRTANSLLRKFKKYFQSFGVSL
ncbi:MAG TPA: hypothetical protein IAA32_03150 [Candidatus Butyricicoccus stercorigallinarum]|nr:hypothetical protein [Candidatus Butyricicoccus stercorigallinarum]